MNRMGRKAIWIVLVVVLVAFAAATYFLLTKKDTPGQVPDFATSLASSTMAAEVTITLELPKSFGPRQEFSGSGIADYPGSVASMTYDLGGLTNAGGVLGQLYVFDVVHDTSTTYIEIFKDEPEWVTFEPSEVIEFDLERLREIILSSPLILPDMLGQLTYRTPTDDSSFVGSLDPSAVDTASETSKDIFEVLSEMGVSSVNVDIQSADDLPTEIEYEYSFPIVASAQDDVTVTVTVKLEPTEQPSIEVPSPDHIRDVKD